MRLRSAADRECDKCEKCDALTFDECPKRGRAEMAADDEVVRMREDGEKP